MTKRTQLKNIQGFSSIVVIGLMVIVLGGGVYLYSQGKITLPSFSKTTAVPTIIPVEQRTNPEPASSNTITVGDVQPGRSVTVATELAQDGYIVVLGDSGITAGKILGKSALLTAGVHTQVVITLSSSMTDGSVIIVRMQDAAGKDVLGEADSKIEVSKNVGMIMTHYDNEY